MTPSMLGSSSTVLPGQGVFNQPTNPVGQVLLELLLASLIIALELLIFPFKEIIAQNLYLSPVLLDFLEELLICTLYVRLNHFHFY